MKIQVIIQINSEVYMFSVTKMDPQVIILLINISCTWKSHLRIKVMINTVSSSMLSCCGWKIHDREWLSVLAHSVGLGATWLLWSVPSWLFPKEWSISVTETLCFYRCFPVHYSNPYKYLLQQQKFLCFKMARYK